MKTTQMHWTERTGWQSVSSNGVGEQAQLVLMFGGTAALKDQDRLDEVRQCFPKARLLGCSTAGEIMGPQVYDNSLAVTGVFFEGTSLQFVETTLDDMAASLSAGQELAEALDTQDLTHVFVLSDGLNVNGSELAKGLRNTLPSHVAVTGGLAGDQGRFEKTTVFLDTISDKPTIAIIGFYGNAIQIGHGSGGGWDSFGPDRLITRSQANVLYEVDGQPALQLYKKYLGDQAEGLPATGLLFPLSLALDDGETRVVRTILSVSEKDGSMTFAGDIPEGHYARLMKANVERLVDGAADSAKRSQSEGSPTPDLAILISCVGRKLVLKQRVDEEVETVQDTLGATTALTGFYSYGEICPVEFDDKRAELHNQTMTVTTIAER